MGGPKAPPEDPAIKQAQEEAKRQKMLAIGDRVSDETRDLLLRFGRNKALSGASFPGTAPGSIGGEGSFLGSIFGAKFNQSLSASRRLSGL